MSRVWLSVLRVGIASPVTRNCIREMSIIRHNLTSNIAYVPAGSVTLNKTGGGWRVQNAEDRPMVLIFEYMNAKTKHIDKFVEFYNGRSMDVLTVKLKPWQLFWPIRGSQVVAKDVAEFLLGNEKFSPIVYHGFSVGGYLWGEVLRLCIDKHPRYQSVTQRVCGQIMDSGVDVTEIPTAFPKAVFPDRPVVQTFFEKFISFQMRTFHSQSTRHYIASRQAFGSGIIRGPTLFIYSDSDPLSTREVNERVYNDLCSRNLPCTLKEFHGAKHVMNYQKHKEEYLSEISNFLEKLNLHSMKNNQGEPQVRLQAKL